MPENEFKFGVGHRCITCGVPVVEYVDAFAIRRCAARWGDSGEGSIGGAAMGQQCGGEALTCSPPAIVELPMIEK